MKRAPFVDKEVVGYHGTSGATRDRILDACEWERSENVHDWLGHGIYFWEESYPRARQWAERKHPEDPAVLQTRLHLDRCMDLLNDTNWISVLERAYEQVRRRCQANDNTVPENRNGRRALDCAVINEIAENIYMFDTARAAYHEGDRVYPEGAFRELTHVQIVVRNEDVILEPPQRADRP